MSDKKEVKEYGIRIGNLEFGTFLSSDDSVETKKDAETTEQKQPLVTNPSTE